MNEEFIRFIKDTSKEKRRLAKVKEMARDTSLDPKPIEVVTLQPTSNIFSNWAIIFGADVHSAAVGSNAVREELALAWVKDTANALYIPGGDLVNSIIKADQNAHDDKFGNQDAIMREISLLIPIVYKIPLMLDGNHDGENGNRFNASNMSPTRHILDALRTYSEAGYIGPEHCKYGGLLKIVIPTSDNKRELKTVGIYFHHGSGRGSGPASVDSEKTKGMAYLNSIGETADAIITGHHHSNADGVFEQNVVQKNASGLVEHIISKTAHVVSESTLQETANYGLANGLAPVDSNVYIYDFQLERNPAYNNKTAGEQPEYIVIPTRIPMFRKNTNELTPKAKRYMLEHMEPDRKKLLSQIERTNTEKLYKQLDKQNKTVNTSSFINLKNFLNEKVEAKDGPKPVIPDDEDVMVRG